MNNFLGQKRTRITSSSALSKGASTIVAAFDYDGGGYGKGGTMSISINGKKVAEGKVEATQGITLGLGGTLDIGLDSGTTVDDVYSSPFRYPGKINKVELDLKE